MPESTSFLSTFSAQWFIKHTRTNQLHEVEFFSESDSSFVIQKIHCVVCKLKVRYRIQKRPSPVTFLRQIITAHGPFSFFKFHFHLVLPLMPRSSKFSLSHKFPHHNTTGIHHLPHTYYVPRPPHTSSFDNPNNIWRWVKNIKLLII